MKYKKVFVPVSVDGKFQYLEEKQNVYVMSEEELAKFINEFGEFLGKEGFGSPKSTKQLLNDFLKTTTP